MSATEDSDTEKSVNGDPMRDTPPADPAASSDGLGASSDRLGTSPDDLSASSGGPLRGVAGGLTLVGGLTWLLLNLHGPRPTVDVLVGVVLSAGGLVLLMPHRVRLPWRRTAAGMALTALAGTVAGLASVTEQVCCAFAFAAGRGFPFHWVGRGAAATTAEGARNLALAADWQVDVIALAADVLFWAFVGLLAVVTIDMIGRVRRERIAG